MPRPPTTLFEDAIDIPSWLEADRLTPHVERSRRDRDIGLTLSSRDRAQRVRGWWRAVGPDAEGAGARLDRIRGAITAVMALLGAVLGGSVALAAFQYDGTQPVNVVRVVALLVVVPALFLLLSLLLLPGRVPLLRGLQDLIAPLNPGALALAVFRRLASSSPELARAFDWRARSSAARFAKWQLVCWSQVAAVGFNVAALATAVLLVTFTDLAFRWSTTLAVDADAVTRIVQALAWPWHALVPSAVPSAELVEQSQFFRLDSGTLTSGRALTAWWPFTVLTIVTYGLLPRLLLLAVAVARLRAATRALLLDDARVTGLVDRMASPAVETAAADHAEAAAGPSSGAADYREATGRARAVIWENCVSSPGARAHARSRLGVELVAIVEAGGSRTLGADRQALDAIGSSEPGAVVVFTPAWEPPLLELLDFLGELRRRVGAEHSIVVAPVADGSGAVTAVEHDTWARAVGRLRDPRLYVEAHA